MKASLSLFLIGIIGFVHAAEMEKGKVNRSDIRVMAVSPTTEPDEVNVIIVFPRDGQVKSSSMSMQVRLDGFPLRTDSDFPRRKEIFNDPEGQSLHVCIDNYPYFAENEAFIDALDDFDEYFEQMMKFSIPFKLAPGMHVARIFPVRSYNESLKGNNCFRSVTFYIDNKSHLLDVDLTKPYLTCNEPQGHYDFNNAEPVLLDFYLTNCELSKDGYKVKLIIDDTVERILTRWTPYYIYGLQKGKHSFRLQLMDKKNKIVPGMFNNVERVISID